MSEQKIILANSSRLWREMLNRILLKAKNLEVVQEIKDPQQLPSAIQRFDAEWVLVELSEDHRVPGWVDEYIEAHPSVRFMAVSTDGSQIKMKWLENREKEFTDLTLSDLLHILEGNF